MNNNAILRRIRFVFDYDEPKTAAIFQLGGRQVTAGQVGGWFKHEGEPGYLPCDDTHLAHFLDGFIIERRGKKDGPQPKPQKRLTANDIFRKLKIALDLKADDVIGILESAGQLMSRHELSAFFRRPDNKHYRECPDQVLRKFIKGVAMKYRPEPENAAAGAKLPDDGNPAGDDAA